MIRTRSGRTDVSVGRGLLDRVGRLPSVREASGIAVVLDRSTDGLFRERIERSARDARPFARASFPPGETSKSLATAQALLENLARTRLDRQAVVVAVGGGVVTDLAGFVASSYLRGVPWVAVPTTLLAMIDAAIGGKTGVNLRAGKNLAGTFHPPRAVVVDLDVLRTLPKRDRAGGFAEMAKIALAADPPLFDALERLGARALACEPKDLLPLVRAAIERKARLVERDERDVGARLALNLGHTTGHALEAATRYGRFHHGEAVAIGLRVACECAVARGSLRPAVRDRVAALLGALSLPSAWPGDLRPEDVLPFALSDKKAVGGTLRLVLPLRVGRAELKESSLEELVRAAHAARAPRL